MNRRNLIRAAFTTLGGTLVAARAHAVTATAAADKLKVVYHLTDLDKAAFVLGNIENHFEGVGGPDHVTIALVVHGPALRAFHVASASREIASKIRQFTKDGAELAACGNTMRAQKVTLADLLPGFVAAEKGGVVRIAELQAQGYLYLRP
jgi:intracellular sulfur oxidation DsrE/DsrF family protein